MSDLNEKNFCSDFKTLFDKRCENIASQSEQLFLKEHASNCSSCQIWKAQINNISTLATSIPQFDVPEALTQKILLAVDKERAQSRSFDKIAWMPLSVVAILFLLISLAYDSDSGFLSWTIGLSGICALKILLNSANSKEQVG